MPTFFSTPNDFRKWLEENHEKESELIVGFYKKATHQQSITWPESVDQALCFGWIDGIRRRIDDKSYSIRFTPRRATSHWSNVNITRINELKKEGLVHESGWLAFQKRNSKNSAQAYHEQENLSLSGKYLSQLKASPAAHHFFMNELAPSYRKQSIWWVLSAKKEDTREKRMSTLIEASEKKDKIPPLKWSK